MRRRAAFPLAVLGIASALGCSGDFDTDRSTPPRGTLGRELYSLVCDRVGAQALREDVTGSSYHAICHPDPVTGVYGAQVDQSLLVPLDPNAVDVDGHPVPIATQEANRALNVARIEAMGRTREPLVGALDNGIPDSPVSDTCNPDPGGQPVTLRQPLQQTLSRLTDLYNDRTIPLLTESVARVLNAVSSAPDVQSALARVDARQGYRPSDVAIGVATPILAYPSLVPFANSLLSLIASDSQPYATGFDPTQPVNTSRVPVPGAAHTQFEQLLRVLHQELRTSTAQASLPPLQTAFDSNDPTRPIYARPLGDLELTRTLFFAPFETLPVDSTVQPVTVRDTRGVAIVPLLNGQIPLPFVDLTGSPTGGPDGFADIDDLGQFITSDGSRAPSPFFSLDGQDGPRNNYGLAVNQGAPMYSAFDTRATMLAKVAHDLNPLFSPTSTEPMMELAAGLPVVFGSHDVNAASQKIYPPDPNLPAQWALAHSTPPPANLGTTPVTLSYAAYHAEDSPLVDLLYAFGNVLADPTTDDTLALFRQLMTQYPQQVARLLGVGLQIKALADAHPEAHIPANSTLWDELLDVIALISEAYDPTTGGVLEDLISAFGTPQTLALPNVFGSYIDYRDQLTYQNTTNTPKPATADLNGTAFNLTTNAITPLQTPVDRTQGDTGTNRSALQRFMQLLHDADGLGACTKEGAVAHLNLTIPGIGINIPVNYPTDALSKTACLFVDKLNVPPSTMPACGILRIPNVAELLLDVALGRAQFDIPDPCLQAILNNQTLTNIVGGPDAFLEAQSGITGFDLHPTVNGISRLVYYDTPHDSDPGDPSFPTTESFLEGVLDPVPSMACDLAPAAAAGTPAAGIPLRTCSSFDLTLRGRDNGALFPLEQLGFIQNIQPLAAAFDDHKQAALFVQLFNTLHLHWGSTAQTVAECDPTKPKSSALWCSQDGAVTYEPLLSAALQTDLFPALNAFIPILKATTVNHCVAQDPTTHVCTKTTPYDGVHVLSEAVRALTDPARAAAVGLTNRQGSAVYVRNDGTTNPQVTLIELAIDALKGVDAAWDAQIAAANGDTSKHVGWHDARSKLVDTFLTVNGTGATSTFANPLFTTIAPVLIDVLRGELAANCPTARLDGSCAWARTGLTQELSTIVDGPQFAATIDLVNAIRSDANARAQLESLVQYLISGDTPAAQQATITAIHDILQVFDDDENMTPVIHAIAMGTDATLMNDSGQVAARSTADALVEVLTRVLARDVDASGNELCASEIDPDHTLAKVIGAFVTPTAPNAPAPIEIVIDAVSDVNRANPAVDFTTKLAGTDYANISSEVGDFFDNKASGLEQVYTVLAQATAN